MSARGIEFIADQGPRIGEAELKMRLMVAERAPTRKFGKFASIIYQSGRIGWRESGGNSTRGHLVANPKGK